MSHISVWKSLIEKGFAIMQLLSLWVFLCSWKTLLISQWYIHKKENRTEDFLAGAYYVFFHLFVVNQKELCVRSCLMANPDLQLLFSHTYLSFSAHPRTQSRCRCHNRPESLLLRARDCYTARSLGLASSKANQTNRKSCLLLTSDDLKPVYRLKKQKKKKERIWDQQLSAAGLLGPAASLVKGFGKGK